MRRSATRLGPLGHVCAALLAAPCVASAQASFTDQDRSVHASGTSYGDLWDIDSSPFFPDLDPPTTSFQEHAFDDDAAPDTDPFSATASTVDPAIIILAPNGSAGATQDSTLTQWLVTATGSASLVGHSRTLTQQELDLANLYLNPPVPYGLGFLGDTEGADSSFSAQFDVASPTPYHLTGTLSVTPVVFADGAFAITAGKAAIVLSGGPLGLLEYASIAQEGLCDPTPCTGDTIDVEGVLEPGSYVLAANADGAAQGLCIDLLSFSCHAPTSSGSFDMTLTLGTPQVPALPPAALPVATALLGAGGATWLRRRTRGRQAP